MADFLLLGIKRGLWLDLAGGSLLELEATILGISCPPVFITVHQLLTVTRPAYIGDKADSD